MPFVTDDEIKKRGVKKKETSAWWSSTMGGQLSRKGQIISCVLMLIFMFLLPSLAFIFADAHYPNKVSVSANSEIKIEDKASVFDDTSELETALKNFQDKTGITAMVCTTTQENWESSYSSLGTYAEYCYRTNFGEDERHFVAVCSFASSGVVEIASYRGGYTAKLLEDSYTSDLHIQLKKYLYTDTLYTKSQAVAKAFDETATSVMKFHVDTVFVVMGVVWFVIGTIVALYIFIYYKTH